MIFFHWLSAVLSISLLEMFGFHFLIFSILPVFLSKAQVQPWKLTCTRLFSMFNDIWKMQINGMKA